MLVIVPEPFSTDHKTVPFCTVAEKGIFSPPSQNDVAEVILSICGAEVIKIVLVAVALSAGDEHGLIGSALSSTETSPAAISAGVGVYT